MPSTYNLYPGLKQILEDKRIKRFGVPGEEYNNYLLAEQFVLDVRFETDEEIIGRNYTYNDLKELGLENPPYNNLIIHTLGNKGALTFYYYNGTFCACVENKEQAIKLNQNILFDGETKKNFNLLAAVNLQDLVVMLATKNSIKQKHEPRLSQKPINGKPHKKGSGAYTLIRRPYEYELTGETTGLKKRAHFRRGHIRKLHPTDKLKWVWVSPCFVNGETSIARTSYLVDLPSTQRRAS